MGGIYWRTSTIRGRCLLERGVCWNKYGIYNSNDLFVALNLVKTKDEQVLCAAHVALSPDTYQGKLILADFAFSNKIQHDLLYTYYMYMYMGTCSENLTLAQ